MELYNFDYYKDSIKKIKCIYTYNDIVEDDTSWEGYIFVENVDGVLDIEGYEIDKMDSSPNIRYIFGKRAISQADKSLTFNIYPGKIAPIHYDMHYNEDDGCFYGDWVLLINRPSSILRRGEAIIRIEDVNVDEKEVMETIKRIADRSKKEYSEGIETYKFLSQNQIILCNNTSYSPAVKKLSRFSENIK